MRSRIAPAMSAAVACLSLASGSGVAEPAASGPGAVNPLSVVRTGIEQWVQTRQLVSRTRSDWEAEKEILGQSKALFERELASIADQLGKVSTNSTQVDRERASAEKDLKDANAALDHARETVAGLEAKVKALTPVLPRPLLEIMRPLSSRLPDDPKTTKTGVTERLQTVVSLLNEIDKFQNSVTLTSENRKNDRGEEVAVESVYVGLGAAFFVNATGDFAGSGSPGPKGWEWTNQPAIGTSVREIIRIYRGERTATFVALPVTIR